MTHKINMTDTYTTRDGRPARVVCVDAGGKFPVVALVDGLPYLFTKSGFSDGEARGDANLDLIPAPKTHKVVMWVNVDKEGETTSHDTKKGADLYAGTFMRNRIACIRVEATAQEGQYDE